MLDLGDDFSLGAGTSSLVECPNNPSPGGLSCHMRRTGANESTGSGGNSTDPRSRTSK